MSMRPSFSRTMRGMLSISSSLVTSSGCVSIVACVVCLMSRAASASASGRRAQIRTLTPSRASARAVSRPIPLLPPVTSAVLSASPSSITLAPFQKLALLESSRLYATYNADRVGQAGENVGRNPTLAARAQPPPDRSITAKAATHESWHRFADHRVEDIVRRKAAREHDKLGVGQGKPREESKCRSLVVKRLDPPAPPLQPAALPSPRSP